MLTLDRNDKDPIYFQIYRQFKEQIISGELKTGERLPATRALCQEYHLSRNTVLYAYQQLESEGFISSKVGSGFYVEEIPEFSHENDRVPIFFSSEKKEALTYDFRYGALEPNIYKTSAFRRSLKEAMNELESKANLANDEPSGLYGLREAISEYLLQARDMHVRPEQILITGGHHYSISLLQKILPEDIDTLYMEEPGHEDSFSTFLEEGFHIVSIPVDENGMRVEKIVSRNKAIAYVTPSHQFPLGAILPIGRRLSLLKWAKASRSYIIEDDYDASLRYKEQPIPSLFSLDRNQSVIYLGSFSKTLSPDLRISYIVLPADLDLHSFSGLISSPVSVLMQLTVEKYIRSGQYKRTIARIRNLLRKKHNKIISFFKECYGDTISLYGIGGGTHFVISLPVNMKQEEIIAFFAERDIAVYPTKNYYLQKEIAPEGLILIGYGGIPLDRLDEHLRHLKTVSDELLENTTA